MSQSKIPASSVESEKTLVKFAPETVLRFWQLSAVRMMRANELIMRGMMGVAKKQMDLGQDLLQHRLSTLQSPRTGESLTSTASLAKAHTEQARKEMERMTASIREVTEDLRNCFSDAAKSLFET